MTDHRKPAFEPVTVPSYPVSIFMAGDMRDAFDVCMKYCDDVGYCVTLNGTGYISKGHRGPRHDPGFVVGFINYPRFPAEPNTIWRHAETLAALLCAALGQQSYTIQAPDRTVWFSHRDRDQ